MVEVIFITQGIRDTYVFAVTDDVYKIKERLFFDTLFAHYFEKLPEIKGYKQGFI